jgi:hypothetical protein
VSRYRFIAAEKAKYPVALLCRVALGCVLPRHQAPHRAGGGLGCQRYAAVTLASSVHTFDNFSRLATRLKAPINAKWRS